jgi:dethiobiotin synthetase
VGKTFLSCELAEALQGKGCFRNRGFKPLKTLADAFQRPPTPA